MNKLLLYFFTCTLMLLTQYTYGQQSKIDSLTIILNNSKADTNKVKVLIDLAWEFMYIDPDTTTFLAKQACDLANLILANNSKKNTNVIFQKKVKKLLASAFNACGASYREQGNYPLALENYSRAIAIHRSIGNKRGTASILGNAGIVYADQGQYPKALENYYKALKIDEELNNQNGIINHLCNIGNIYADQTKFKLSLTYYFKALKINEEINDPFIEATILCNIGISYADLLDFEKALDYYFRALKLNQKIGNLHATSTVLGNISLIYGEKADYSQAINYSLRSVELDKQLGNKNAMARHLGNIGLFYIQLKEFTLAQRYLNDALQISTEIGATSLIKDHEDFTSRLYEAMGKHQMALVHYKRFIATRDTIANDENTKAQARTEMQYEFDKQQAADSIKTAERAKQEEIKHSQEIYQQKVYTYFGIALFIVMLIVALISFRAFKNKQKVNLVIAHQKELVDEKQKEILDSIHYAKRIQQALLPSEKSIILKLKTLKKK